MGRLLSAFVTGGLVCVAALAAAWFWLDQKLAAPGPSTEPQIIVVEPGSGMARIAAELGRAGLIEDALLFRIAARATGRDRALKAGEYETPAGASMDELLRILEEGRGVSYKVTAPEGSTSWEIVQILNAHPDLAGPEPATPPEGRLLPETYFFDRGDSKADVLRRMSEAMDETLARLWAERAPDLPIASPEEALTLASIVEKETALPEEYGLVASVLENRLERGMRLQMDPTVIYGITEGKGPLGRRLLRADLETDHPYNTYTRDGLPIGPIANPGVGAIEAVLNPLETDYYYFVADGEGGHVFARTLDEHNRNVREWRTIRRERERAQENAPPRLPERRPSAEESAASEGTEEG